jgi:hypothetical protein
VTTAGGASAVPAGGGSSLPFPGGFGYQPAGTMTGVRGARCNRGRGTGRDNPAAYWRLPREAWPKLSRWDA